MDWTGLDARTPSVLIQDEAQGRQMNESKQMVDGTPSARLADMNPLVRAARVQHLQADMALQLAIRKGHIDEVALLAQHKTECIDQLIEIMNAVEPGCFDLPEMFEIVEVP